MRFVSLLLFLLLYCCASFAEQVVPVVLRSTEILTDGDNRYYLHQAKKGETEYSISRAYGVTEDDLRHDNPVLSEGLKVGQWLKIIIPIVDTARFAQHVVQPKETLYSIAKQYGVSIDSIDAANPNVGKTLPIGVTLQIPIPRKNTEPVPVKPQIFSENGVTFTEHVVKRKQTLYAISNLYEVSIDDITAYNPQIFSEGGLKVRTGQTLRIPISLSKLAEGDAPRDAASRVQCDSSNRKLKSINVALLLPLDAATEEDSRTQMLRSFRFVEMYEGALMALETLREQGLSVNLTVLDTKADSSNTWLHNSSLAKADLIIGPVYQNEFKAAAAFAQSKNIKIVSPLTAIDSSLYGYDNVFQVQVNFDKQIQQALTHERIDPFTSNIILISQRDNEASKKLSSYYRQFLPGFDSVTYRNTASIATRKDTSELVTPQKIYEEKKHAATVKSLSYKIGLQPYDNQMAFLKVFDPQIENKVIVASQDEPFVADLLTNLKVFSDRFKCKITIYGTNSWLKFENVEPMHFYNLKLHLAAPYYTNYRSETVKNFVQAYRDTYKTEPSQFAFQGYDVMLYFVSAMHRYGKNFEGCLPSHHVELLQSTYDFVPMQPIGAYENRGVFLLRYTPWMDIVQYK